MSRVHVARRALRDIDAIDRYSIAQWGSQVADEYIAAIDQALETLGGNPTSLRSRDDISAHLLFYRVRKHFLVCDILDGEVYVLAVVHGSMDLPARIAELEPMLIAEAEALHRRMGDARH